MAFYARSTLFIAAIAAITFSASAQAGRLPPPTPEPEPVPVCAESPQHFVTPDYKFYCSEGHQDGWQVRLYDVGPTNAVVSTDRKASKASSLPPCKVTVTASHWGQKGTVDKKPEVFYFGDYNGPGGLPGIRYALINLNAYIQKLNAHEKYTCANRELPPSPK